MKVLERFTPSAPPSFLSLPVTGFRVLHPPMGTFVEGIKEEVVLSPAHALSLIAAGEEHRHVGSTNFNLLSSRSHTIFTLTIESSPCGENSEGEAVTLSQLNLIDLAGSESSKAETTGMRRREGSYINKSLLTLGTVISKLTEDKPSHIPYRDSKLTRLLQSSLSGHGRVSLICTVTPSSSSTEETHNTLKFAHRAKHIEIQAAQNKIIDEKSLIKKYQQEIQCLKEELEQLKRGIVTVQPKDTGEDDIVLLKQKESNYRLEDGQVKLQSRLEQEEEAKAALLGRIQRLTKLILVSTKASHSTRFPNRPGPRRRHSFGEEELAYLPYKRRDLILDEENIDLYVNLEGNVESAVDSLKEEKRQKTCTTKLVEVTCTSGKSSGAKSTSTPSTPQGESGNHAESRLSHSLAAESSPSADLISEAREDKDTREDSLLGPETPLTSIKSVDQIDLLREQHKILCGEVALHSSAFTEDVITELSIHPYKLEFMFLGRSRVDADFRGLILVSVTCDWLVRSHSKQLGSANFLHYGDIIGNHSIISRFEGLDPVMRLKLDLVELRGFKALCCSSCRRLSMSSIEEAESSSASDWLPSVSSIAQAMVQERLEQLIRERRLEERCRRHQQSRVRERTKFVVMVAIKKCFYDPREDFKESMMEMITADHIKEARDLPTQQLYLHELQ
ncbi:uncharacterized protein DS421_15g514770 [Arachis hypogaea]|nr:uncharacterized protein DS421_15g514770 [Arachis hypogaea]